VSQKRGRCGRQWKWKLPIVCLIKLEEIEKSRGFTVQLYFFINKK
jgi:hypothetical protein